MLVEVDDTRAGFVLQLLKELKCVKVEPLSPEDEAVVEHIDRAMTELKDLLAGRLEGKPATQFLAELRASVEASAH